MEPPRFFTEIFSEEDADLSWVPDRMDPDSSYRLAVRVGAYMKFTEDGGREYCKACNIPKILDRDSTNWNDVLLDIGAEIKLGSKHKLRVTYWDKMSRSYEEITSDQKFLHAIDMYWEIRRLSVQVCVMKINDSDSVHDIGWQQSMSCALQGSVDPIANQIIEQPAHDIASSLVEPLVENNTEVAWVDDDVEYVGLDDEDLASGSSDFESDGDVEFVCMEDELVVEDAWGCESIVHATDLENPTIEVGITFGDGDTFKKAIRQYAIKGEYEIAAAYSESGRYRGYCKAERCQWRIHASQLQDGRTWKIKKLPHEHTCQSTGKVEKNCMATNHWVRDRVLDWLAKDPKIGAKTLQKRLEEQYHLKLSYWVVWDGRNMALEQLKGKWDDSFEHVFSFKAEVEKTNPGSLVDIEFEQVGKKMRFTRMFVALKACVDGFLNGCRPFLGVDSTHLTGKWKGQLASATAIDGNNCTHALCIITSIRGYNIEEYVHEYYSVAKFKKAYGKSVKPMTDRKQWPQVNPGFKLWPPILKRAAGRPRERRYKSAAEGGTKKRTTRCKRCNQLGHMAKTCNEYVYNSDAPPPAPPKPKRKRGKKNVTVVPSKADVVPYEQSSFVEPFATPPRANTSVSTPSPVTRSMSRRLLELEPATPTRAITPVQTPSPMTRGRKRMLELEGFIEPVACASLSPLPISEKGKTKEVEGGQIQENIGDGVCHVLR